jgi:hypothetical protein
MHQSPGWRRLGHPVSQWLTVPDGDEHPSLMKGGWIAEFNVRTVSVRTISAPVEGGPHVGPGAGDRPGEARMGPTGADSSARSAVAGAGRLYRSASVGPPWTRAARPALSGRGPNASSDPRTAPGSFAHVPRGATRDGRADSGATDRRHAATRGGIRPLDGVGASRLCRCFDFTGVSRETSSRSCRLAVSCSTRRLLADTG